MSSLGISLRWLPGFLCALLCIALTATPASPQTRAFDPNAALTARCPAPEQVLADYADDAERYVALKALYVALQPAAAISVASPEQAALYNACNDIDFRLREQSSDPSAYAAYTQRVLQLTADARFRESVLARYGMDRTGSSSSNGSGDPPGDELDVALRRSIPYWIAALVLVLVSSPILVLLCDRRRLKSFAPDRRNASSTALPDSLHTIAVLGRSYDVEWLAGVVVDKETTTEQRTQVSTTGGGATVDGDQLHVSPTQVHVSTSVIRKDCMWVRDASGNESAWNFTNTALQARPGHALSGVVRRDSEGAADFLLAYNHVTGQMDSFGGLARAHQPRKLAAWLATTIVGAGGVLFAMFNFIDGAGVAMDLRMFFMVGNWTYPLVMAGFLAAITVGLSASIVRGSRTRAFNSRYVPEFRRLFEQNAPR